MGRFPRVIDLNRPGMVRPMTRTAEVPAQIVEAITREAIFPGHLGSGPIDLLETAVAA